METKVLKRVIGDMTTISQIARMLRDSPMDEVERIMTTNTLCDSISTLLNSAKDYLDVAEQLHVSGTVKSFIEQLEEKRNGNNEESK